MSDSPSRRRKKTSSQQVLQPSQVSFERGHSSGSTFSASQQSEQEGTYFGIPPGTHGAVAANYIFRAIFGLLSYITQLCLGAMFILKPFFSLILAVSAVVFLLAAVTRSLVIFKTEVQTRIACRLPLVSYLLACPDLDRAPLIPNFSDLVNKQAASYEFMVESLSSQSAAARFKNRFGKKSKVDEQDEDPFGMALAEKGLPLPLLLKRAELAVVDLKVLVKHSGLEERAKAILVDQLQAFHTRAKVASRKMQFLQARANGCVDSLVIRNVYLTLELDRLEEEQRLVKAQEASWYGVWYLLSGSNALQTVASEAKLQELYQASMGDARDHVRDLILQAQDVLSSLDDMDQILSSIHETTTQEKRRHHMANEETLAMLWSRLGGNRLQKGFHRENLELLQDMEGQRKATVGQIQAALWKLTDFEAEIGILREKIVEATVDGLLDDQDLEGNPTLKPPHETPSKASAGSASSSLRAHILQIDRVTTRLKERSFLADSVYKSQADKILPAEAASQKSPLDL